MTQPQSNPNDNALGAFAGLVILIVILAILFALTTPTIVGDNSSSVDTPDSDTVEVVEIVSESADTEATETVIEAITDEAVAEVETESEETTEDVVAEDSSETAEAETPAEETADTTSDLDPAMVARGEELFITCSACHGPDARGIAGLGKDLIESEFSTTATDSELAMVITMGRPIWDAANTTGVDMPPKGGNPTLTSEDIDAIVAYIRSLQGQ